MSNSSIFFDQDNLPQNWEALLEREMMIRNQHIADVEDNSRRSFEQGTWSKHAPVREMMSHVLPVIIEGVQALINKCAAKDARKEKPWIVRLSKENWKNYSYLALTTMLDACTTNPGMAAVWYAIGSACEEDAKIAHWEASNPSFFNYVLEEQRKKSPKAQWIIKGLSVAMNRYAEGKYSQGQSRPEAAWEKWPIDYKKWLAHTLCTIICSLSDLFEIERLPYRPNKVLSDVGYKLLPSQQLLEWVGNADTLLGLRGGFYLPLPGKPRHWTDTQTGGFHTQYGGQLRLIKNRNQAFQEEALELTPKLQTVFAAVNAAQDTAWRVNHRVFETLKELVYEGKGIAELPRASNADLPPCPKCGQPIIYGVEHKCFQDDEEIKKTWKAAARAIHRKNAKAKGQRLRLSIGMEIADILADDKEFYYVYQCDFRGRLYPVANLSPQGTDWEKGILEFAQGVPLGKDGAKWLAINLANQWGNDKVSYEARQHWTHDNETWIRQCAQEPLIHREWADADSPFQFLAACMEWDAYKTQGDSYESHIPVGLDGSCSGIQHYSAMLKDEIGALATNVKMTPGQTKKSDIYGMVADVANKAFEQDMLSADGDKAQFATLICSHKLIDRKVTKRSVMTLPYGSTYQACHKYVGDALTEKPDVMRLNEQQQKQFTLYASKVIWDSIPLVVRGARLGMSYLKTIAKLVCKSDAPVTWTAPTGFPVFQSYYLNNAQRIKTSLQGSITLKNGIPVWKNDGKTSWLTVASDSSVINPTRQVSGIAPNFIHSLDASHLMFSVEAASQEGIHSFALVHDSLGTHAGNTEQFFTIIRRQFHRLYTQYKPLETFTRHIVPQIPEDLRKKVPEIPYINTLDTDDILNAAYLFS